VTVGLDLRDRLEEILQHPREARSGSTPPRSSSSGTGPHLFTTCKTPPRGVALRHRDWARAEAELELALLCAGSAKTALRADAAGLLAEPRIAQSRLDDAR